MSQDFKRRRGSPALPTTAIIFFSYFAASLLLMHLLRSDYTIPDHMISDYAVGPFGWIMTSAFVALGFGCLALAGAIFREGSRSWLGRVGASLLVVAFAGLIVTAIFPTDLETAPSTSSGDIHAISFLVNIVSILASTICLALSYINDPRRRPHVRVALALAGLLIAAFLAQYLTLHRGAPFGVTNRLFVTVLIVWLLTNSFWLRSLDREASARR